MLALPLKLLFLVLKIILKSVFASVVFF